MCKLTEREQDRLPRETRGKPGLSPQNAWSQSQQPRPLVARRLGTWEVSGGLEVRWTITGGTDNDILALAWTESGGPAVQPPIRRGFGTTLIERALTHELDAEVRRGFAVPGLRCTIEIPLTEEVGRVRPTRYSQ